MPYVPEITSVQRDQELVTYQDLVEHVLDLFALDRSKGFELRQARRAVTKALRDVSNVYKWSCYRRMWVLKTDAYFNDGTVSIDFETRLATFSESTPAWAAYGTLQILGTAGDGPEYEVERRVDATTLLLRSEANVASDLASTSSYRLVRRYYPVPVELKEVVSFQDVAQNFQLAYITPSSAGDRRVYVDREPDMPRQWTLRGYSNSLGSRLVELTPAPDAAYTYHVGYIAAARPLQTEFFQCKATLAADGTTVTSSETLPENIVGSVVRFSSNTGYPTPLYGGNDGNYNPWTFQRVIQTRASATTFTIDSSLGTALTDCGAIISDPVDILPRVMLSAVQAAAEYEFACLAREYKTEEVSRRLSKARAELTKAIENNSPGPAIVRGGSLFSYPTTDYELTYGSEAPQPT